MPTALEDSETNSHISSYGLVSTPTRTANPLISKPYANLKKRLKRVDFFWPLMLCWAGLNFAIPKFLRKEKQICDNLCTLMLDDHALPLVAMYLVHLAVVCLLTPGFE